MRTRIQAVVSAAALLAGLMLGLGPGTAGVAAAAAGGAHHPLYMPNISNIHTAALQPPPILLPPICLPAPVNKCVPYQVPPAGQPTPINMAYFGGNVEVHPTIYLVLWGWGQAGAFSHGQPSSDPDGAAARMTSFLGAIGGTPWAGVQTQYFQTVGGTQQNITNPAQQLAAVWHDDSDAIHANVTGLELAQEAARAVAHFHVADLANSQFVIAQPQNFSEAGFNAGQGYCAWHDLTSPAAYPGVQPGIAFTNMPYVLNQGATCGQNSVNAAPAGNLDGFTIVLGHEVEETVTDPGAETVVNGQQLGGWFDLTGYENGDKCAWVGDLPLHLVPPATVPGGLNNITGNDGRPYAVQSLWSNNAALGLGYCAGAGNDLPF